METQRLLLEGSSLLLDTDLINEFIYLFLLHGWLLPKTTAILFRTGSGFGFRQL